MSKTNDRILSYNSNPYNMNTWSIFVKTLTRDYQEYLVPCLYYGELREETIESMSSIDKVISTYEVSEHKAKLLIIKLQKEYLGWLSARDIKC